MSAPIRIQLRRTKGWRMPENTVKVDRSTNWGNPYAARDYGGRFPDRPVDLFRDFMASDETKALMMWGRLEKLRGKNLACWCALDAPCHADVLLELANKPEGEA